MENNDRFKYYVVELYNNYAKDDKSLIRCYTGYRDEEINEDLPDYIPIVVVKSPDNNGYIEFFTHKPIVEKTEPAMNGLSYISIRRATASELKKVSFYSKISRQDKTAISRYCNSISAIESESIQEYETYLESLTELESNLVSSGYYQLKLD